MFKSLLTASFFIVLILLYQNCSLEPIHEGEFSSASVTEGERIEIDPVKEQKALNIIQQSCTSCHQNSYAEFGINLEGNTLDLIGRGYVVPGMPEASILYKSIVAESRTKDGVTPMPVGNRLSVDSIAIIEDWIKTGIERKLEGPEADLKNYSYNDDIQKILEENSCLQCHSSNSSNSDYIVLDTYQNLMSFVQIGSESSLLLDSIVSGRMPKGNPKMPEEDIKVIRAWIFQGAVESHED